MPVISWRSAIASSKGSCREAAGCGRHRPPRARRSPWRSAISCSSTVRSSRRKGSLLLAKKTTRRSYERSLTLPRSAGCHPERESTRCRTVLEPLILAAAWEMRTCGSAAAAASSSLAPRFFAFRISPLLGHEVGHLELFVGVAPQLDRKQGAKVRAEGGIAHDSRRRV